MLPALKYPRPNWKMPANTTASKKGSNPPSEPIAVTIIAVKPAAGPDTLICELDKNPTTIPPIIPEIIPEKSGAPLAKAMPKHRGKATKNTTRPAKRSVLKKAF